MAHTVRTAAAAALFSFAAASSWAQLIDRTQAPNAANEGIAKSFLEEIGAGRGDWTTPDSSSFIIARDPFRAIRRGRQLFQRKFTRGLGQGPLTGDGAGDVGTTLAIGAGFADSCASCHGRPRGSAGVGGDVATRPDSRDSPHLFGLGLKEMLADEITADLRASRDAALQRARRTGAPARGVLRSKGIDYGYVVANPDGSFDTAGVQGVDADLRVKPFFAHGGLATIREFIVGAMKDEMGLEVVDPELTAAGHGTAFVTPAGMAIDPARDTVKVPVAADATSDPDGDGVANEVPAAIVDYLEFYLLNYFKPATYRQTQLTRAGKQAMAAIGCTGCHVESLTIAKDRRVADVETAYDPVRGLFNSLFATAAPLLVEEADNPSFPPVKHPAAQPFVVRNLYADFKRHDVGPGFYERNYDGTLRTQFMTLPLWGIGTTAPYGHDGRSVNLREVILRHGGEATAARNRFAHLPAAPQAALLEFLQSLVLFPPDDTASNLDAGDRTNPFFPQLGHGSIRLTTLFNNPLDRE